MAELSGSWICREGVQVQTEKGKFTVVCSRSPQNLEFGHFRSLFCRERQRNVPKCKTHLKVIVLLIKTYCFAAFSLPSPSWFRKVPYIPNETPPLSQGIAAVNWFLLYTKRNAAVKSWYNGHLFVLLYAERNAAVKSWDNGRLFVPSIYQAKRGRQLIASWSLICFFFIPNETRPLSHGIAAVYRLLLYTSWNVVVYSWDNGRVFFPSIFRAHFIPTKTAASKSLLYTEQDNGLFRDNQNRQWERPTLGP